MDFRLLMGTMAAAGLAVTAAGVEMFEDHGGAELFRVENGTLEAAGTGADTVLRWRPAMGQQSVLELKRDVPLFDRLRAMDHLAFEFRIAAGRLNSLGLDTLGLDVGPRRYKVHNWAFAFVTTPTNVWIPAQADFSRPGWFPWDNPDGEGTDAFFRFTTLALEPDTVLELRRLRATPHHLLLKPDFELPVTWPLRTERPHGGSEWRIRFELLNSSPKPDVIEAEVLSAHRLFKAAFPTSSVPALAGVGAVFELVATLGAEDARTAPPLYAEPLRVAFRLKGQPGIVRTWEGELAAPLPASTRRQAVLSDAERDLLRQAAADPTGSVARAAEWKKLLARADEFRRKELLAIPGGHAWVPRVEKEWVLTDRMPEITNAVTGEREFGTDRAGNGWKAFLEYPGGAAEALGLVYRATGDESYARQALAYFRLLGQQYGELGWSATYEKPWNKGLAILSASRVANGSSYSGNFYMRGQLRLLNLVADSPSWTEEERKRVYEGFALPYALESLKFRGGINNMTDIGNHNVLLIGLAFGDAGLVRRALYREGGVLRRLEDIDAEGLSSEARPISYHRAGMAEYMPSLVFLARSGLKVELPRERLLEAFRMPYRRAALSGVVPNTGDCARWMISGPDFNADWALALFPEADWLKAIARAQSLTGKLRAAAAGEKGDGEGWRDLLETEPRLFREAGLAILRRGETAEAQVMATLDYGRNLFHAHADRLQITLMANGIVYSHGPGSIYNVGSGGMTNGPERLRPFITGESLSQNVILADGRSQNPAVGRLLAWQPGPGVQWAAARVDGLWPGVSHTRALALAEGVVVVFDRIEAEEPHTYDFVYHNLGRLAPGEGWSGTEVKEPLGESAIYGKLADVRRLAGSGPVRLAWDLSDQLPAEVRKAGGEPALARLDLWQAGPEGGEVYTVLTGLNNPNTKTIYDEAPTLLHRIRGRKQASFATVLAPGRGKPVVQSVEFTGTEAVRIVLAGGRRVELSLKGILGE